MYPNCDIAFVIGEHIEQSPEKKQEFQKQLAQEAEAFHDILQGDFVVRNFLRSTVYVSIDTHCAQTHSFSSSPL